MDNNADLTPMLQRLLAECRPLYRQGKVANYIPALAQVAPQHAAVAVATLDGQIHSAGDAQQNFSLQSISKIFGLVMAMNRLDDELWQRVNMEPSGQPFNSIVQLEWEQGIPRNPVINAGAILVADVLVSHYSASKTAFLTFLRRLTGEENIYADQQVYLSELEHGNRNAALAYLMKSFGNIEAEVPLVLEHYFHQCATAINCEQLARSLLFLANRGVQPHSNEQICSRRDAHRVNAILSTSGMYDQSGEFAFQVGLPAKSGVGGAIVAIVPQFGVITAWSPPLNRFGNSVVAMQLIRQLADELGLSLF
ncbi:MULTISPECIES: glutaminase B [unclassified Arsukibacterium]|uniref:glutaminase B n=1 Tax=unclassified Arsukibacterium TaxID=2635278 RepID=UPI000C40C42F|nr:MULTISPECIES: glutaminase B [unclassified Arsukibacterium]MAA93636.1 glutaminase [Rheinheimera sp.]MBM33161.1 glutaminase [Rheinheimera sp.]|tara:strand:- start:1552 stop:2478 length:927 start_codon:yes stop_codon:yes gene_type:complete